jgi:uncharacterized membrane protein HdeD (DUF308 family)
MAYFYFQNSLGEFVKYNFFFNLRYPHESPYGGLQALTIQNPYLVTLGSLGLILQVFQLSREWISHADSTLALACLGLIAGLFLIPNPYPQYYLMFLPLLSLFASMTLISILSKLATLREQQSDWKWIIVVAAGTIPVGIFLVVFCRPIVAAFWFSALLIAIFFLSRGAELIALAVFLMFISIPPQVRTYSSLGFRNTAQLDGIRYVIMNTAPSDSVMDGFTGSGVFRPHAYFYFMLHAAIRSALSPEDWNGLLEDLQTGRVAPKLIIFDNELRALPGRISRFIEDHYRPTGRGEIWERSNS